jgi:6-phosphogluconolactonase
MTLPGEIRIVPHVPAAFATLVTAERPRSITLSGGDTARACYALFATAASLDWSVVDVLFGDERWVPVHDHDSNEGMARLAFLDEVEPAWIHSMYGAGPDPDAAAAAYDGLVGDFGPIDLVHLGLGPDGHTASLFPGTAALEEQDRWVITNEDALHPHPRLTFTFPAIAASRLAVFTVAGEDKRDAFTRIRSGEDLPGGRVAAPEVIWLVDPAAAGT